MTFKSKIQPLCRFCGRPIAKHSVTVYVKAKPSEYDRPTAGYSRYAYGILKDKADCQRHANGTVLSIKYTWDHDHGKKVPESKQVYSFTEWDGDSYVDRFFCNGEHAKEFGYAAARIDKAMPAYNAAVAAQIKKVEG